MEDIVVALFGKRAWHMGLHEALEKGPCLKYYAEVVSHQTQMGHAGTVNGDLSGQVADSIPHTAYPPIVSWHG